jgi:hypothetical protein
MEILNGLEVEFYTSEKLKQLHNTITMGKITRIILKFY